MLNMSALLCAYISFVMVQPNTVAAHKGAVKLAVNQYLNAAFALKGEISVGTRIQSALNSATRAREVPGKSSDTVLRDSEYYLHGLYAASNGDARHAVATAGAPIYEAFKYIAWGLKAKGFPWLEEAMRTDKDKPTSQPGGWEYAYEGLKDGKAIDGKVDVPPRSPHGLQIRLE